MVTAVVGLTVLSFPIPSEIHLAATRDAVADAVVHVAQAATKTDEPEKVYETRKMWITAYSSTPDQTDETPFETALGTKVRDGIVATNMLPFGTKVRFPKLFGDKVFVVEDRMHVRKVNFIDIWMPKRTDAMRFGISYSDVQIVTD